MENKVINFRTDLACEEVCRINQEKLDGIQSYDYQLHQLKVNKIVLEHEFTGLSKKPGSYYTIDLNNVDFHDTMTTKDIELAIMEIIEELMKYHNLENKKCLIVGLGNVNITPDSLGPFVLDNVVVTRHLFALEAISPGYGEVAALTPGVMGNTGIETFDIIASVVKDINVDFLIVVDALAAASLSRVNKTIQITDTGISPGSGVGNKRKEVSFETLGIPVIAIGVPTVVDAVTIVSDALEYIMHHLKKETDGKISHHQVKSHYLGQVGLLDPDDQKGLFSEVLTPAGHNMLVTPKDVDADIEDLARIIAAGIDFALHQSLKEIAMTR